MSGPLQPPRRRRATSAAALLLVFATWIPPLAHGSGTCEVRRYRVWGRVMDPNGRPLEHASVYLLLDEVSQKKFNDRGMRARSGSTNAYGRFRVDVVCEPEAAPNPCAAKPKHVTVAASSPGHRTRMQVFRLKDLETDDSGCGVVLPDIVLRTGG